MTLKTSIYLITSMILTIVYPIDGQWNRLNVSSCPDPDYSKWEEANKNNCLNPSKIFHCQTDYGENIIYSMCARQQRCGEGTHAYLNFVKEVVECQVCSQDFFQAEAKDSQEYIQPNCDRKKQACGEGKEVCQEGTAIQDNKCRCIHEQGYFPEQTDCDCFTYDSTCTCGHCEEGKELVNGTNCVTSTTSSTTTTTITTTATTTGTSATDVTSPPDPVIIAVISVVSFIVIIVIIVIIIICCCPHRKKKIKSWFIDNKFARCKFCGDPENSQHDDTTDSNRCDSHRSQNGTAGESDTLAPSLPMNGLNGPHVDPTAPPEHVPEDSRLPENQESTQLLRSGPVCSVTTHDQGELCTSAGSTVPAIERGSTKAIEQKLDRLTALTEQKSAQPSSQSIQNIERQIIVTGDNVNIGDRPEMNVVYQGNQQSEHNTDQNLRTDGNDDDDDDDDDDDQTEVKQLL